MGVGWGVGGDLPSREGAGAARDDGARAAGLGCDGAGRRGRRLRDASQVLEEVASSTPKVSWEVGVSAKTERGREGGREGTSC